jgi:hypothetical protein
VGLKSGATLAAKPPGAIGHSLWMAPGERSIKRAHFLLRMHRKRLQVLVLSLFRTQKRYPLLLEIYKQDLVGSPSLDPFYFRAIFYPNTGLPLFGNDALLGLGYATLKALDVA